jgi:surface protein
MSNPIKYTAGTETLALKKGNFFFGTGDVGKGPTNVTGYYNGVDVPKPGYVVYQYKENVPGNLTYGAFNSDTELINFTNGIAGQTFTSVTQCFTYYAGQTDKVCFNRDYEPIITDGLILNVDAGFDGSYPASGTTWRDLSVSGNNGTLTNNPGFYDNGGGGIVFDGTDDFVNLGNQQSLQFTNNFSSFCWLYKNVNQYQKGLVGNASYNNGGWQMSLANNFDKFVVIFNSNAEQALSSNSTLNAKQWYHCGFTFLDGVLRIYIDGVFNSQSTGRTITTNTNNFVIGKGAQGGWGSFNGNLSSVQVYNRALSESEILQNYNAMKDRFAFIFTVDTTKAGTTSSTQFKLPLVSSGSINFVVEWGDGTTDTITTFNQAQTTHTYSSSGTYEIKIRGLLNGWQFNNGGDKLKMGVIKNWGCLNISVGVGFAGCTNMTCVATDAPIITSTSLDNYFSNCVNFNGTIGNWDVSLVTNMTRMFEGAQKFNQNIGGWNVGNVTNMSVMFQGNGMSFNNGGSDSIKNWNVSKVSNFSSMFWRCPFNQPIGSWDVSSATNMSQMFLQNTFNQDIGSWNVSNVTNMSEMFRYNTVFNNGESESINNWRPNKCTNFSYMFSRARFNKPIGNWTFTGSGVNMEGMFYFDSGVGVFNQDIGSWNVSGVTNMSSMFQNTSFNQNIGNWNVSGVTNMSSMFLSSSVFNNGGSDSINNWNTSNVTNMSSMFQNCYIFNQNIGSWNVSKVTNMQNMFSSNASNQFNQNIGSWNVSKVTNMSGIFRSCVSFNQPIGNWTTSGVTTMSSMFENADAFNQDISNWDINQVTSFTSFLIFTPGLSTINYDLLLVSWESQTPSSNININFGGSKYTANSAAATARQSLVNTYGWTITDGGQV